MSSCAGSSDSSTKGKSVAEVSDPWVDQLIHGVADVNLKSTTQNDDGWEVKAKKSKNKYAKPWGSQAQHPNSKPWGHHPSGDSRRLGGRGGRRNQSSNRVFENDYRAPPAPAMQIRPPLQHGWNRQSSALAADAPAENKNITINTSVEVAESEPDDVIDVANDDDELLSDDFDSDCSQKSHETRKKSRWFKAFFEDLDGLSVEQINDPDLKRDCPACQGGPGAIKLYPGLQPLLTHAMTIRSKRVNPHRELAELLDEEMRRRGTNVVPGGEAFGKWKGLENVKDKEIVWPPMVVIMNTTLEKDEKDNKGHRGMSILVFEASAVGYLEAERLSTHFEDEGTNRDAWDRHWVPFLPGGERQLYGYMAEKEDLDNFNKHSTGNDKLKYEMRSYHGMVVSKMKQMSKENQQLICFKDKVAKEQRHSKALEETCGLMSEQLRKTAQENRIVRQRTKIHHEQNKEEMDSQEQFFRDQIEIIRIAREAKEDNFEEIQQERLNVKQSYTNPSREEEVENFMKIQDREMKEFVLEREKMEEMQEEKRATMKRRHLEEALELEKEFEAEFTLLMERYTPSSSSNAA